MDRAPPGRNLLLEYIRLGGDAGPVTEPEPSGTYTARALKKLLDALVICPCTGNTLGKLASGVADTTVTLSAKSHLRNEKPVVIAMASNDGLSGAARNIGELLGRKHYYLE